MSRLRNRMISAEFYTDPELLRWPSAKRDLYRAMWAMAEDSACIEDDPFGWKCAAFPSPLDAKSHSVAKFTAWRDELIEAGKAIPYEAGGVACLFLPDMAEHEHPRNPQSPNLPLPPWVTYAPGSEKYRSGAYTFDSPTSEIASDSVTIATASPVLSCPVLSKNRDRTPVSSGSTDRKRKERGSYPQDDPTRALLDYAERLGRDPTAVRYGLTADETASVKRWVRLIGTDEVCVQLGYASQDGYITEPKRIGGSVKASAARSAS